MREELTLSKAMKPCSDTIKSSLILTRAPRESLEALLERQRSEFLEYAAAFRLKSNQHLQNSQITSLQTLTLPTKCYAVEFNDDFVTISTLK